MNEETVRVKALRASKRRRFFMFMVLLALAVALVLVYSVSISQYPMGFLESYQVLVNRIKGIEPITYAERMKDRIVWDMNMPRAIGGIVVGCTLAVGGAIMQSTMKNPLADPYLTGISSGALLGVTIYIVFGLSIVPFAYDVSARVLNAFILSLIPVAVILLFSLSKKKISPSMMILTGVGMMYVFSSISTLVRYNAPHEEAAEIYSWIVGSIGMVNWDNLGYLLVGFSILLVSTILIHKCLNIVSAGDELAKTLGVNTKHVRMFALLIVSISTAIAVSFTGSIGFVGLVSPHIGRILVGSDNKYLLPCSAAIGALMMLGSDCIARNAGMTGLPVGAVTALIGSPIFIYLLIRQRKSKW